MQLLGKEHLTAPAWVVWWILLHTKLQPVLETKNKWKNSLLSVQLGILFWKKVYLFILPYICSNLTGQ